MPKWTSDQQRGIELRHKNLLVSAAAGSGKTAVLVERIIQLVINDKVNIDELLIVTFTNAAASEMRGRIERAINDAIVNKRGDEQHLRRQIHRLGRADIETLHAFCLKVIRDNFHAIDIDPNFSIGDPTEMVLMQQEAADQMMQIMYENSDEAFIKLVEGYTTNRDDQGIINMVERVHNFMLSQPEPFEWLDNATDLYCIDIDDHPWLSAISDYVIIQLEGYINMLESVMPQVSDVEPYIENFESDIALISHVLDAFKQSFFQGVDAINHLKFTRLKSAKEKDGYDMDLVEQLKSIRSRVKDGIKKIAEPILPFNRELITTQNKEIHECLGALKVCIKTYHDQYQHIKTEENIIDFSDAEHMALKLLKDASISDVYREKFSYIFIDEYQDSNPIQEALMDQIKRDDNLFMVGDVKQSIYKFRLADPSLFLDRYKAYSQESLKDERVNLSKNFRSRDNILQSINFTFYHLMHEVFGEIEYDQDHALYTGTDFQAIKQPSVAWHIVDKGEDDDHLLGDVKKEEIEATYIANQIKQLIGRECYDPKAGTIRPIQYKDIVILSRATKAIAPVFQQVFTKMDIPIFADAASGYFQSLEVKWLMDYMRLLDNEFQDAAMLSYLRSPLVRLTANDLAQIRAHTMQGSYTHAVKEYSSLENLVAGKLFSMFETMTMHRKWLTQYGLQQGLWRVLDDVGLYTIAGGLPGGESRQANLRLLLERAKRYEATGNHGLYSFIQYIERLERADQDLSSAVIMGEQENVVRLLTIHKSKGLEFPVVILTGTSRKFNMMDTYGQLLVHKNLGISMRYADGENRLQMESLSQMAMKWTMQNETASEEMRILYVALTRAVDQLHLVSYTKSLEKDKIKFQAPLSTSTLMNAKHYYDWLGSIWTRHPDLIHAFHPGEESIENYGSNLALKVTESTEISQWLEELEEISRLDRYYLEKPMAMRTDDAMTIVDRFAFAYDYDLEQVPLKRAATHQSTVIAGIEVPTLVEQPAFLEEKINQGILKGNAYHRLMMILKYAIIRNSRDVQSQYDELIVNGIITPDEASLIDINDVIRFFESDLGKRLIEAKDHYKEQPFLLNTPTGMVQGIIDLYFEDDDGIVLVDYKSDFVKRGEEEEHANRYSSQLSLYEHAIKAITGKDVTATYIYFFTTHRFVKLAR